jgi:hypothetical protein
MLLLVINDIKVIIVAKARKKMNKKGIVFTSLSIHQLKF